MAMAPFPVSKIWTIDGNGPVSRFTEVNSPIRRWGWLELVFHENINKSRHVPVGFPGGGDGPSFPFLAPSGDQWRSQEFNPVWSITTSLYLSGTISLIFLDFYLKIKVYRGVLKKVVGLADPTVYA